MTLQPVAKTDPRFLEKVLHKRRTNMLVTHGLEAKNPALTPFNANVGVLGGSKRLLTLRNMLPINCVALLGVAPLNIIELTAITQPGMGLAEAVIGLLTVGISAVIGVGVRENMLVNRLQPWVEQTTVSHLAAWLKMRRDIVLPQAEIDRLREATDLVNNSRATNTWQTHAFTDVRGDRYTLRRLNNAAELTLEDKWGLDILNAAEWQQHQANIKAWDDYHASVRQGKPVKGGGVTLYAKPGVAGGQAMLAETARAEAARSTITAPTSVLSKQEAVRVQKACDTLMALLKNEHPVEVQHGIKRAGEMLNDIADLDAKLAVLSSNSQKAGKASLLETLTVIEAEIEDLQHQVEQVTVSQAATLAGYAKTIHGSKILNLS